MSRKNQQQLLMTRHRKTMLLVKSLDNLMNKPSI